MWRQEKTLSEDRVYQERLPAWGWARYIQAANKNMASIISSLSNISIFIYRSDPVGAWACMKLQEPNKTNYDQRRNSPQPGRVHKMSETIGRDRRLQSCANPLIFTAFRGRSLWRKIS